MEQKEKSKHYNQQKHLIAITVKNKFQIIVKIN